jgi:hypothetical protein
MTEEKKMKVEFAPGAFDSFEGTQEELDEMVAEIQTMFAELTPEELEARSRPVDVNDLIEDEDITEEQFAQILTALIGEDKRKLQ